MNEGRMAAMDRLPWLADDAPSRPVIVERPPVQRPAAPSQPNLWPIVIVLSIALVGLIAYQMGANSPVTPVPVSSVGELASGGEAVSLPQARDDSTDVELVIPEAVPDAPAAARPVARPSVDRNAPTRSSSPRRSSAAAKRSAESADKADEAEPLTYWPAYTSAGATGRMVRIGTFESRSQAKKGWWEVMRLYPGMQKLNAVVVPVPSKRDGKTYYRLQMGTTSQAHSEVLCQRMRIIGQSCVVVGVEKKV